MATEGQIEQRISNLVLGVADVERSARFYEALGWQRSPLSRDTIALFNANGMVISLTQADSLASHMNVQAGQTGGGAIPSSAIVYVVRHDDDLRAIVERATQNGARLLTPVTENPGGTANAFLADPDGHVWEIARTTRSQVKPDGTFQIGG